MRYLVSICRLGQLQILPHESGPEEPPLLLYMFELISFIMEVACMPIA